MKSILFFYNFQIILHPPVLLPFNSHMNGAMRLYSCFSTRSICERSLYTTLHRTIIRSSPQQHHRQHRLHVSAARGSRLLQELAEQRAEENEAAIPVINTIEWKSPLEILKYPHPQLRAQNARIGVFDDTLKKHTDEMFEIMYQDDGVGLAAPQVGVNLRLMVFNESGVKGQGQEIVLVNPKIISTNDKKDEFEEGCLSFPEIYANIIRPTRVKIKAQDLEGKKFQLGLTGFPARIFQHEYDHLEGKLFHDRMSGDVLGEVKDQLVALEEEFVLNNPGVEVRRI